MKKLGLILAMIATPVAAQNSHTNCYRLGNQMVCDTVQQPQAPAPDQNPAWMQMLNQGAKPDEVGNAFAEGQRRGNCDRAVREQNALGVQAYCR